MMVIKHTFGNNHSNYRLLGFNNNSLRLLCVSRETDLDQAIHYKVELDWKKKIKIILLIIYSVIGWFGLPVCCLTPLLTIFQLYSRRQFYWWRKQEDPGKIIDLSLVTDNFLSHNVVHLVLIEIRTHNISGDRHWLYW
jgi:hypothetical protein